MMEEEVFYVLAFHSTSHSIQTEKKAKEKFQISVIPTPRELSNDCGLAIKFLDNNINSIMSFYEGLTIPCDLYRMSVKKYDGKRRVEKINDLLR